MGISNEPWYGYYDGRFCLKSTKMLEKYLAAKTNKHPAQFECHMAGQKIIILYYSVKFPHGLCLRYMVTQERNGNVLYMYNEKHFNHIVNELLLETI